MPLFVSATRVSPPTRSITPRPGWSGGSGALGVAGGTGRTSGARWSPRGRKGAAAIRAPEVALPVMDDEFQTSYQGVTLGVPVLTKDGEQFGILEHVLAVEEEDIFEGIVVWVGGGWAWSIALA